MPLGAPRDSHTPIPSHLAVHLPPTALVTCEGILIIRSSGLFGVATNVLVLRRVSYVEHPDPLGPARKRKTKRPYCSSRRVRFDGVSEAF
ncbi:hypothetical protein B296_00010115 [Ensete ventricosum]|uniref:Uncharacterized protein n=1 Tax=Ensete ventricosum TaxID=4639 RepID=A0A427B8J0_ENSVE|nr:hypothetical protein B296_00010115 [Ensete ventricosum]